MNWDRIDAEEQAVQSLSALYEQARKCQQLHELAQMSLPERLQRFLGMNGTGTGEKGGNPSRVAAHITAPEGPRPPKGTGSDWISIDIKEAIATTVILAILRGKGDPIRSRDLTASVTELLPNVTSGSIANAGTRLSADQTIERTEDGWKLLKPEKAGLIQDDRLWGPLAIFGKQEMAAHRREAIIHVLKHFPTGLQTVQIVEQLRTCRWVHATVSKDVLKLDMEALQEAKKVRRRGNTRKWEISPVEKGE